MVILRATQKVLRSLPPAEANADASDTALGDWYVNRMVIDRQPLLLLLSSTSLLSIVIPARAVRNLPDRLPGIVAQRLRRLGVAADLIEPEIAAMVPVRVGPTKDRSVVGTLVDFAKNIPYYLSADGWDDTTLPFVEGRLAHTPCRLAGRGEDVIWPDLVVPALLERRWRDGPQVVNTDG